MLFVDIALQFCAARWTWNRTTSPSYWLLDVVGADANSALLARQNHTVTSCDLHVYISRHTKEIPALQDPPVCKNWFEIEPVEIRGAVKTPWFLYIAMATAAASGMPLYAGPKRQSNLKCRHFESFSKVSHKRAQRTYYNKSIPKRICWRFAAVLRSLFFTLLLQTLYHSDIHIIKMTVRTVLERACLSSPKATRVILSI